METKDEYKTVSKDQVDDAMEMLGVGYAQPSIVIEPERTTIERRNGQLEEIVQNAWIKFSTAFKAELPSIENADLKVFIFIALSVNRDDNRAHPGTRAIAEGTGLSKDTVTAAVRRLEKHKLLLVARASGKQTVYEPLLVSANSAAPSVLKIRTVERPSEFTGKLSENESELSENESELSERLAVNLHNQRNQSDQIEPDILDGILNYQFHPKAVQDAIAMHFRLTPNWEAKYNQAFMRWAVQEKVQADQIATAAQTWKMDKRFNWAVATLKGIQEHWLELISPAPSVPESKGWDAKAHLGFDPYVATPEETERIMKELAEEAKNDGNGS